MSGSVVIRAENVGKQYRLGTINHGTLYRDLQSWWALARGRADPNAPLMGQWVHKHHHIEKGILHALKNVNFDVHQGEILGVIGGNGAGKSTLLKILSRITAPTEGWVGMKGRISSLLEVGSGFHPELTGRENIFLNGATLGMQRREIQHKFDEIVDFAEVSEFVDTPVKRYSSGMYVRLAFSVAAHLDSEILLVDEVLAVGDISFQRKCLGKMSSIGTSGRTILFVSHNMAAVERLTSKILLLKGGEVSFHGGVAEGVNYYQTLFNEGETNSLSPTSRSGDGRAQIADVWLSDEQHARLLLPKSGQKVILNVVVEAKREHCRDIVLAVGVTSSLGDGVLHLSTKTSDFAIDSLSGRQLFSCTLPKLTLGRGDYSMNFYLTVNGMIADWLVDAYRFQVGDGDFYGTGKLPPEGYSRFLADYQWSAGKNNVATS